jgi:hypothetical protein
VLLAAVWGTFGFVVVILLAGLQNIDESLIDAASVDGANWLQRTRHVIVPQLAPLLTMVTTITLIGGIQVVDFVFVMTLGGPGTASEVMATYAYKIGFTQNDVGLRLGAVRRHHGPVAGRGRRLPPHPRARADRWLGPSPTSARACRPHPQPQAARATPSGRGSSTAS